METTKLVKALVLIAFFCCPRTVRCSPPAQPVTCLIGTKLCKVTNAYGTFPDRSTCRAAEAAFPETEAELVAAVASAVRRRMKMRVATRYSHAIPKLSCPASGSISGSGSGGAGVGGSGGLVISTARLRRVMSLDAGARRITVEAGATLRDVIDASAEAGLALTNSPYWDGLSVGGVLATGAHGSSLFGFGSAVHEYVAGVRLVVPAPREAGFARVVELGEGHPDLNAAKVSLGLLGVVSQVTLKLEAVFKRSVTNKCEQDTTLENDVLIFGGLHEFADITWYASQRKAVFRKDDRVPLAVPGNGVNDYFGFRPWLSLLLSAIREIEATEEKKGTPKCLTAELQVEILQALGLGFTNNGREFTGYPVIGMQHNIQSAGTCLISPENDLLTACPWDPRVDGEFFYQIGVSIALSNISAFISDVKALRDLRPGGLCGLDLYTGILMRYVRASSAYLGKPYDSVDLDISFYRAREPDVPTQFMDVLQELEQMALFKYWGVPHWGKNRNIGFKDAIAKFPKAPRFVQTAKKYDPHGFFSNEWTDAVLGLRNSSVEILRQRCAIEGLCVCSQDEHCAPEEGYFCRPGLVYKEARVCRRETWT